MPTRHIDDATWRKVEKKTVDAVIKTQAPVKSTEILKLLIEIGLENFEPEDFEKLKKKKK